MRFVFKKIPEVKAPTAIFWIIFFNLNTNKARNKMQLIWLTKVKWDFCFDESKQSHNLFKITIYESLASCMVSIKWNFRQTGNAENFFVSYIQTGKPQHCLNKFLCYILYLLYQHRGFIGWKMWWICRNFSAEFVDGKNTYGVDWFLNMESRFVLK